MNKGKRHVEIWGHCKSCERWFYCEGWFDREAEAPTCPVCGSEPTEIENRAAARRVEVEVPSTPAGMA